MNYIIYILVGGFNCFLFPIIYGMSSFPLTKSIIFQDGQIAPPISTFCRGAGFEYLVSHGIRGLNGLQQGALRRLGDVGYTYIDIYG